MLVLPMVMPRFYTYIFTLIFVTSLLAMSLNVVVGHGGLFQFHHAAFYGVGAYTFAILLTKTSLPMWIAFIAAPLAAALAGLIIGSFCVRLTSLYFAMLQISLGSLIYIVALRWYGLTGGDDGIHGIPLPEFLSSSINAYYFVLGALCLCLIVLNLILRSPFGTTLQAIRDNPERCAAVGINVRRHQLMAIVIATFFAGVAGALFVVLENTVFPELLFWSLSLEIFIMCLLGGWFTFAGPMVGAAITVSLRTFVGIYTDYWTLVLGIMLILLIFFLPEGVMGFIMARLGAKNKVVKETE
ncbi:MAG: branched-chain amino acid ABC transporter permease [Deltaproteobacteria bacterium]|nr:branched-chain amino acid ABC transporter permease [Deltaproteobacteria bacterium]